MAVFIVDRPRSRFIEDLRDASFSTMEKSVWVKYQIKKKEEEKKNNLLPISNNSENTTTN